MTLKDRELRRSCLTCPVDMYKTVQRWLKGVKVKLMVKDRALVLGIVLCATCLAVAAVHGKTGTFRQQSYGPRGRVEFVGEVVKVDAESRSMTLRSRGKTVSFDISNAVLQGYGSIAGIKKGDRVGVGYTTNGIRIVKSPKIAVEAGPEKAFVEKVPSVQKPKKPSPFARRMNTDGKSFADVDNNKDGKITPIELSVVMPNLTMEQFRRYDKNHDGHLDRAEFEQITLP